MQQAWKRLMRWVVWLIGSLYFLYDFTQQVAPSAMGADMMRSLHINALTLSNIASVYFYSYGILQIPVGLLVDKFGPRRPLAIAALVAAACNILFAIAKTPEQALWARLLVGAGAGFSFVTVLKIISNWFPQRHFATLVGVTNIIGMLGAIGAEGPLAAMVRDWGWRGTSYIFVISGFALALIIILFLRDYPPGYVRWSELHGHKRTLRKVWSDLADIVGNAQTWINGVFAMMINITYVGFGDLWGTLFLRTMYHIDASAAATAVSMLYVGAIPGGLFFGWFSDYVRLRKMPMILAAVLGLIVMPIIVYVPHVPLWLMYVLIFMLGVCGSGNLVAYAVAHDLRPQGSAGTAIGFVNTLLIGGSALFNPVIGFLLDHFHKIGPDPTRYSLHDYRVALTVIVVCLVVTLLSAMFLRETHAKSIRYT